ncbi:zinc induced facilitator-like 2 [Striga asiatica]|uniref:Zinc induced facilitator-like 2 n=1 Tax=Striga asiatica TaxID=4170 RepID=A0A5A7QGY3_STRAF|nr:zinc induced facilitator-like 2 [Striga asiatica]
MSSREGQELALRQPFDWVAYDTYPNIDTSPNLAGDDFLLVTQLSVSSALDGANSQSPSLAIEAFPAARLLVPDPHAVRSELAADLVPIELLDSAQMGYGQEGQELVLRQAPRLGRLLLDNLRRVCVFFFFFALVVATLTYGRSD